VESAWKLKKGSVSLKIGGLDQDGRNYMALSDGGVVGFINAERFQGNSPSGRLS
jgi:hypothetical protein